MPEVHPPSAAASRDDVAISLASAFEKCHAAISAGNRNDST